MSNPDQFDNKENSLPDSISDTYTSESTEDIYNTPDTDRTPDAEEQDTQGVFSGNAAWQPQTPPVPHQNEDAYGFGTGQGSMPAGNTYAPPGEGGQPQDNGQYGSQTCGGQPQNNEQYGSQAYGGQPQDNGQYGSQAYGGQPQNNGQYGSQAYGGQPQNNGQYGSQAYGGQPQNNGQSWNQPYGGNGNYAYSPYAVPQKKSRSGLIIGVVIALVLLIVAAVIALAVKAVRIAQEDRETNGAILDDYDSGNDDDYDFRYRDEYNSDDDYHHGNDDYHHDDDYHYDDHDYDYNYDGNYDYDSDEYYTLHDDIKYNLSYSVDFEYYSYDTDYENVVIMVDYPVIEGKDVPNLSRLNSTIASEIDVFVDYFENEYKEYLSEEDSYFTAYAEGYITYMDEEKLSIVFSEQIYSDYYDMAGLYCININMDNGVILDNERILDTDDAFSVEFRKKSDIQNGEIDYLTALSDQEITEYFNSSDIIVFYTPHGMEIGFNYEYGWVTVTYDDYEKYLMVY